MFEPQLFVSHMTVLIRPTCPRICSPRSTLLNLGKYDVKIEPGRRSGKQKQKQRTPPPKKKESVFCLLASLRNRQTWGTPKTLEMVAVLLISLSTSKATHPTQQKRRSCPFEPSRPPPPKKTNTSATCKTTTPQLQRTRLPPGRGAPRRPVWGRATPGPPKASAPRDRRLRRIGAGAPKPETVRWVGVPETRHGRSSEAIQPSHANSFSSSGTLRQTKLLYSRPIKRCQWQKAQTSSQQPICECGKPQRAGPAGAVGSTVLTCRSTTITMDHSGAARMPSIYQGSICRDHSAAVCECHTRGYLFGPLDGTHRNSRNAIEFLFKKDAASGTLTWVAFWKIDGHGKWNTPHLNQCHL